MRYVRGETNNSETDKQTDHQKYRIMANRVQNEYSLLYVKLFERLSQ